MNAIVQAVRSGSPVDDGALLCRSTLVAIMGRMAAASGRPVRWADIVGQSLPVYPAPTMLSDMIAG